MEHQQSLPFEIVHLTDTHLSVPGGVAEGTERKRRSMYPEGGLSDQFTTLLRSLPTTLPDAQAIFLTGDLVDTGVSDEYEALVEALAASPLPVHAIPGNHDHMNGRSETVISPNNYLTNTADPSAYESHLGPRWYSFDIPGLHVVAMDWHTHELGLDNVVQEEWLRNDLALVSADTPWALLFHDQPNDTLLTKVPRPPVATFSATGTPRGWYGWTARCTSTPRPRFSPDWTTVRHRCDEQSGTARSSPSTPWHSTRATTPDSPLF